MIILENVLTSEELVAINEFLAEAEFSDGKYTAGKGIQHGKKNLQLPDESNGVDIIGRIVVDALLRHPIFYTWARPLRTTQPTFARYTPGMHYGPHMDAAILGGAAPMRSDLSLTLFLSDPTSYDGGELAMDQPGGTCKIKLPAGSAVVYPTQVIHEVCEVTRGQRHVSVLWIQSMIKDPHIRQTLFDLEAATNSITEQNPISPETLLLQKTLSNLQRHFTET